MFSLKTWWFLVTIFWATFNNSGIAIELGIVSYWDRDADYNSITKNALALINPNDGILKADKETIDKFARIINSLKSRNVRLLGYVATGNGDRKLQSYATISKQIKTYFETFAKLDGIFFDEIGYKNDNCTAAKLDMGKLRELANAEKSGAIITWNPGWVGENWCYIKQASKNEIVMDFESEYSQYIGGGSVDKDLKQAKLIAKSRGVKTWHAIHSTTNNAAMETAVRKALDFGADFVFVTNIGGDWQHGENTYGQPPVYWKEEINYFAKLISV